MQKMWRDRDCDTSSSEGQSESVHTIAPGREAQVVKAKPLKDRKDLMKTWIVGICLSASSFLPAQDQKMEVAPVVNPSSKDGVAIHENNFWEVVQNRRSVRKFRPDSIPGGDIVKIIDAARMAPTSGNQQPWKFLVVKDRNQINRMKEACVQDSLDRLDKDKRKQVEETIRTRLAGYFSAPVYIVVLTDNNSKYPDYNHWDGPLAAGYLMLAARALGYGTVFITDAISESVTKEVLHIPDAYTRVCITPLGIPSEWPATPPKKKLDEFIIYEHF
jgi:nitroreductase